MGTDFGAFGARREGREGDVVVEGLSVLSGVAVAAGASAGAFSLFLAASANSQSVKVASVPERQPKKFR